MLRGCGRRRDGLIRVAWGLVFSYQLFLYQFGPSLVVPFVDVLALAALFASPAACPQALFKAPQLLPKGVHFVKSAVERLPQMLIFVRPSENLLFAIYRLRAWLRPYRRAFTSATEQMEPIKKGYQLAEASYWSQTLGQPVDFLIAS